MSTIFAHYKSTIASLLGLILVYLNSKGYVDPDLTKLLSESIVLLFWVVNVTNHMNSKK